MPAVPKRKPSTRRQGKRRATHQVLSPSLIPCSQCGESKLPHRVCPHCGHYRQKEVLLIKPKEKKKKQS